jgi:RimJ/RimL family protein N-acetyltransferase
MVFEWRNAPETRKYFFNPGPLLKEGHINWFKQSLQMSSRCLLIAEYDQKPIGVLRYDIYDTEAEIDIYIQPGLSGKGFGTRILQAGHEWIKEFFPRIVKLQAKILPENKASIRIFEKTGFTVKTQIYEKIMDKNP